VNRFDLKVGNIPAILWGDESEKIFITIHGNMSNKADDVIIVFAEEATKLGFQVLSFDLPKHGDRKSETTLCKVQNCVEDLNVIMEYAKSLSNNVSVFGCSIGAYFSLVAYMHEELRQALFLSPVVNMGSVITNMMKWFDITEERLMKEKEIVTSIGEVLYWDYYSYVKEHPIVEWRIPTSILYGSEDNLTDLNTISSFSSQFKSELEVLENGEHYFHTEEQLSSFRRWANDKLMVRESAYHT
jgi:alpha-beta hydrolase superfamily lysophospholipase